jgi:hypothetical protein
MAPPRKTPRRPQLVCDRCGTQNAPTASACRECGSERFAPSWVLQLRRVNRNFAVQITKPSELSDSDNPRLTLYKWWPGGRSTLHIPTSQQWDRVKEIIDTDLASFLGWKSRKTVKKALAERQQETNVLSGDLRTLAEQNPLLLTEIMRGLQLDKITEDDVPQIGRALSEIARVMVDADSSMRRAIERIVKQLPAQGEDAIEQLSELMESVTLTQIAAVTNEVRRRVNLLNLFKERVTDDRTYEIKGEGSIHRLLEQAMWIVDERYWLMHSNETLRKVVGKELARQDESFKSRRPDFVCGTVDKKLIIIEIKRPSHVLEVKDLNQLERYVVICQQYSDDISTFEAILVGRRASDDLRRTLKVRGSSFKVKTYVDLIADTERRYQRYLEALDATAAQTA